MSDPSLETAKQRANALFAAGKFSAAHESYTEIIAMRPSSGSSPLTPQQVSFFSACLFNRGMAQLRLRRSAEAEGDFRSALELEPTYYKACFSLGQVLAQHPRCDFPASVAYLERCLDLCRRQKRGASDTMTVLRALAKSRFLWHKARTEEEAHRLLELEHAVKATLSHDFQACGQAAPHWQPSILSTPMATPPYVRDPVPLASAEALASGSSGGGGGSSSSSSSSSSASAASASAEPSPPASELEARMQAISSLFAARRSELECREVPDWATDPVTLDVMTEAVLTPGGQSYDRASILECLKVKKECPVTRVPLMPSELAPNYALRKAISEWVAQRPWANPRLLGETEG
jgi:tetratricopeptide (TPR) repeat protein